MIHPAGQQRLPSLTTPRPPPHRWRRRLIPDPEKWNNKPPQSPATVLARCPCRIGHAIHGQGASARVEGVRPGCAVAVRLDAGHSRESFAVAVQSNAFDDPVEVRRIKHQVVHEVVAEVDMRPRNVVVVGPGTIPKTPSGKLRRGCSASLLG